MLVGHEDIEVGFYIETKMIAQRDETERRLQATLHRIDVHGPHRKQSHYVLIHSLHHRVSKNTSRMNSYTDLK